MSVKLGIAPIAWSNDDMPELGGDTSLEQCLSEASQAGFIGIESGGKFPKNSEELIPKLKEFSLNLCSGWYGANLRKNTVNEEKNLIQAQLKLFKDCNSPCMVFAEVSGSNTIRLLENTDDSVKLTLDTGHMLFAQGNSLKILKDFSERLIHIHCKDIRKNVLDKSLKEDLSFRGAFLEGAFTVPGDGCIDYKPLFDVLKQKNYSGWLVVEAEQDPAKANPFEYAKIGYKYLTDTLNKSNIEIFKN